MTKLIKQEMRNYTYKIKTSHAAIEMEGIIFIFVFDPKNIINYVMTFDSNLFRYITVNSN